MTRLTVMQRLVPHLGGYVGPIASGGATSAVLTGLIDTTGDDTAFVDGQLLMPDAATAADQERRITVWDDSAGQATFVTRADTDYSNETYLLLPRGAPTLTEIRDAIDEALRTLKRTVVVYRPLIAQEPRYPLRDLTWLRSDEDVDAVRQRGSPNLLDNEDFAKWHNGADVAPDGWTLGQSLTVTRQTVHSALGPYAVRLAVQNGELTQFLDRRLAYALVSRDTLPTLAVEALVHKNTATDLPEVGFRYDLGGVVTASFGTTGSSALGWERITHALLLTAAIAEIELVVRGTGGTVSLDVAGVFCVEGTEVPDELVRRGSDAAVEGDIAHITRNAGSPGGEVLLARPPSGGGQLVIYSRRPYAELTSDSDETDCPTDVLVQQALYELFSLHKPGQDRERLDRLALIHGRAASDLASNLIDLPAPPAQEQIVIGGA